jgi:hypothetical protein
MVSIRLIRLDQGLNVEHDLPSENFNFGQIGDQAGNPPHKKRLELFLIILLLEQVRHHSKRIEPDVVVGCIRGNSRQDADGHLGRNTTGREQVIDIENAILLFDRILVEGVGEKLARLLHLPLPFHAEKAQNRYQSSGDGQNDRNRDLVNQINERELRFGLIDDVAAMRADVSVLRYLPPAFFAFNHRHKYFLRGSI